MKLCSMLASIVSMPIEGYMLKSTFQRESGIYMTYGSHRHSHPCRRIFRHVGTGEMMRWNGWIRGCWCFS